MIVGKALMHLITNIIVIAIIALFFISHFFSAHSMMVIGAIINVFGLVNLSLIFLSVYQSINPAGSDNPGFKISMLKFSFKDLLDIIKSTLEFISLPLTFLLSIFFLPLNTFIKFNIMKKLFLIHTPLENSLPQMKFHLQKNMANFGLYM